MKKGFIFTMVIVMVAASHVVLANSEGSAAVKDKMKQLNTNVDNSKANRADYEKNLKVIESNLSEIQKTKSVVNANKTEIDKNKSEVKTALAQINKNEAEIKKAMTEEQTLSQQEVAKVKQLEEMITKVKAQIEKREQNIANLKKQADTIQTDKITWTNREKEVKALEDQQQAQAKKVQQTESTMVAKKKGYEAEIERWKKETDKHERVLATYNQLAR